MTTLLHYQQDRRSLLFILAADLMLLWPHFGPALPRWTSPLWLLQHDGCAPGTVLGESRNFIGPLGNWLFFNNGFHSAHHQQPGAHWSTLPARHALLRANLPGADLEQPSILAYLWQFGWRRWGNDEASQ